MRVFFLMSAVVFTLLGCATSPTISESSPIPADRLLLKSNVDHKDSAEIVVIRDRSIAGSSCYYAVYIDDQLAARIGSEEKATFKVSPGTKQLKVKRDPLGDTLCASGDDMTEEAITLKGAEKKVFQLSTTISGWPYLENIATPSKTL